MQPDAHIWKAFPGESPDQLIVRLRQRMDGEHIQHSEKRQALAL